MLTKRLIDKNEFNYMKRHEIKINGIDFRYYSWGKNNLPKLFFIHGYLDSGVSFNLICNELSTKFHCIAIDLRGFGESSHSKNELGNFYYEYLADIHKFFNYFSPNIPVKVVGHSMGGNILSLYAGSMPHRVSHFMNIEGLGVKHQENEEAVNKVTRWLNTVVKGSKVKIFESIDQYAKLIMQNNPNMNFELARNQASSLTKKVQNGYALSADPKHRWINPYIFHIDQAASFWKKITAKCIILTGESSDFLKWISGENSIQDEVKSRVAFYPKGTQLIELKNCGHIIHLEKHLEVSKIAQNFF